MIATVEIAGFQGQLLFRLREGSNPVNGMLNYAALNIPELPGLESPANVREYGAALARALKCHHAVNQTLQEFFTNEALQGASLQFDIATIEAERYKWEALYEDPVFLAIRDRPCSMLRVVSSGLAGISPPCAYDGRIRMLALLSPARVASGPECRAIKRAFAAACTRYPEAGFSLHVLVGEMDLLEELKRDPPTGLSAALIPSSTEDLEQELRERAPQILHCFCHGLVVDGIGALQFATRTDHERNETEGSVHLSIARLLALQNLSSSTWLTVLNSCSGAEAIPRLNSMAASLTRTGSAVTVGMAEKVHAADATLFAGSFYKHAMPIIGEAAQRASATQSTHVDLGSALASARRLMHRVASRGDDLNFKRWCLPVMYQRNGGLDIVRVPTLEVKTRLEMVARSLRSLPSDAPRELRAELRKLLSAPPPIDESLWPDLWGNFR